MKKIILVCALAVALNFSGEMARASLIVDFIQTGCGWSDLVYQDLFSHLAEKSKINMTLKAQGKETGRRLYFFSDDSWFLTFEYLSSGDVERDISCVVAHGPGSDSEHALNFVLTNEPEWRWGEPPKVWP